MRRSWTPCLQLTRRPQYQIRTGHNGNPCSRYGSSTSSSSASSPPFAPVLTPADAGRRAQKLRLQEEIDNRSKNLSKSVTHIDHARSIDTILAHSGFVPYDHDSSSPSGSSGDGIKPYPQNSSVTPPIHLSTTYVRPVDGNYDTAQDAIYIRDGNPTRLLLEQQMSALELKPPRSNASSTWTNERAFHSDKSYSFAMSSGMMAISTVIMAHTLPIHVILPQDLYHGVPTLIENVMIPHSTPDMISYERVDMRDPTQDLTRTLQRLSTTTNKNIIVWIETPSNPLCHVIDIAHTCHVIRSIQRSHHWSSNNNKNTISIVVDSTLAPPNVTQPLRIRPSPPHATMMTKSRTTTTTHDSTTNDDATATDGNWDGVDVVIHSGTKYVGGHSDAMGGIITVSPWTDQGKRLHPKISALQVHQGGMLSPMDSYLMIRGLRTLHVRVERQSQSALVLAQHLQDQMYGAFRSYIKRVYYPGLPPKVNASDNGLTSDLEQQQQQQRQYEIASEQMMNGLYGSILSIEFDTEEQAMAFIGGLQLVVRATSFGGTETLAEHRASIEPASLRTSPAGLVRLSVGLENVNDLRGDIENALRIMSIVCPAIKQGAPR